MGLGRQARVEDGCLYQAVNVKNRIVDGCAQGSYTIDQAAFRSVSHSGNDSSGGSIELSFPSGSVNVSNTLFVESENEDCGACLRAEGFSFACFKMDCFYKAKTRSPTGSGQTTSLHSHTNTSEHISNSITACSPDTNQGFYTINFDNNCNHKSIIYGNNISHNKLSGDGAWFWRGIEGDAQYNTLVNNVINYLVCSSNKDNLLAYSNIIDNTHPPGRDLAMLFIDGGSLSLSDSFIISNVYSSIYASDFLPPNDDGTYYNNTFSTFQFKIPFTHNLQYFSDWECVVDPIFKTSKFTIDSPLGNELLAFLLLLYH